MYFLLTIFCSFSVGVLFVILFYTKQFKEQSYPYQKLVVPKSAYNKKKKTFDRTPLFCFVNPKSGGKQGNKILNELRRYLNNDCQIIDVTKTKPNYVLSQICAIKNGMILICGGDGTIGWILNIMNDLKKNSNINIVTPIAVFPLGTGNDFSNIIGWGLSASINDIPLLMLKLANSKKELQIKRMDRWCLKSTNDDVLTVFSNYFSIGVDAQIAYNFHILRNKNPENFVSQFVNKLWYGLVGGHQILIQDCYDFYDNIRLFVNDEQIELPENIQGLIFCNINSYAGGTQIWNPSYEDDEWEGSNYDDKMLEILAVDGSLHLANVKVGTSYCHYIYQIKSTDKLKIQILTDLPMQSDGEPWIERTHREISIEFHEKAYVLVNDKN
jgi:diacylglycerol kinase (ATP)